MNTFGCILEKLIAFFSTVSAFLTGLFGGGNRKNPPFENDYAIPETLAPYARIDTTPKTDWKAKYIWDGTDGSEENVWMCFRKTVGFSEAPEALTAFISADSRYWLYINGKRVVFEGGVKRGPTPADGYYDPVEIGPYLKPGRNLICALVWYWGKDTSYSNTDSGKAGFLFEAGDLISDGSWKARRNTAYRNDGGKPRPNYRLPESNVFYDARREVGDWLSAGFDDSAWENASENGVGGCAPWGKLYPRAIPLLKDYGRKDYENTGAYVNLVLPGKTKITLDIPYNAQCTPYLRIEAPAGKKIKITTENTKIGSVRDIYITKNGEQEFEALGWFNGEHVTYAFPGGVRILALQYRETGYDTAFAGRFSCGNENLNTLWQKSLRTLYVTMRDSFMDCPDRERAQWWGDVTNEMAMMMYSLDANAYLLYQKGVASMLGHIDPAANVLQTVVPISRGYFELPVQQLAGVCGFWTYYLYTGDTDFLRSVYDAALNYVNLWTIGDDCLVNHRCGSWDWMDWGGHADVAAIENAWYYHALSCLRNMAGALGRDRDEIAAKMSRIKTGYASLWTVKGYKSGGVLKPDDRANALAVIAGLAGKEQYDVIAAVLTETKNASPYMEYYVLEALCQMERYGDAMNRMLQRYDGMIREDYSTLWEHWYKIEGTLNHAWSGGPLVIMSKYFSGIRPVKAGYRECVIKPQMTVSDRLDCVVPTVKGYIRLSANKTGGSVTLDAAVPKDTAALIHVPYTEGQTVTLNGRVVYQSGRFIDAAGAGFVEADKGFAVFSVESASDANWRFEAKRY